MPAADRPQDDGLEAFPSRARTEERGRSALSSRDRSLITLAAAIALNAGSELPLHVDTAVSGGVTSDEVGEVIAHLAFYSGWPSAIVTETSRIAVSRVFDNGAARCSLWQKLTASKALSQRTGAHLRDGPAFSIAWLKTKVPGVAERPEW